MSDTSRSTYTDLQRSSFFLRYIARRKMKYGILFLFSFYFNEIGVTRSYIGLLVDFIRRSAADALI
jgi:hypothetical protein